MNQAYSREVKVYPDAGDLASKAAIAIARAAGEAIRDRGRFTLVLAGGSTPRLTYELLAQAHDELSIDWSRVYLFFGDERLVPHTDSSSNFYMAQQALLGHVAIAREQVLAVNTEVATAAEAADDYCQQLAGFFGQPLTTMPVFDMVLLGLGDDGHTASLFPEKPALTIKNQIATWSPPGVLPPQVDRVTLTFDAINAARQATFLVSGANKAPALRDALTESSDVLQCPAAGVRASRTSWLVDQAAATLLPPNSTENFA